MIAESKSSRLRLLVAIASYGQQNLKFLKHLIETYRKMPFDTEVVVLSEAPKDLGPEVTVRVGLPSPNPWSLPFAHKALFAEQADRYDLFAYTEDDMEVTEENIRAFLRVTPQLASDEIAGFFRYELDAAGVRSLPDVRGIFHWKPETARRRGDCTVAEFTNEHAAFFLLTQSQLKRAIASGGFVREPCEGTYDMLCTAATDPYTNCGFRKVICVSEFEQFLIHHMPNRYTGHFGLPLESFKKQIQALMNICAGSHPVSTLCKVESTVLQRAWSKSYYENPSDDVLALVPAETRTLLSIGCGWGAAESRLVQRGVAVTALPLDSVIGAAAAQTGIEMIYAPLEQGMNQLKGRQFDAILLSDLLQLLEDPHSLLERCGRLLRPGGVLVMTGPNFDYLPVLTRRVFGVGSYRDLQSFSQSGIRTLNVVQLRHTLRQAGLNIDRVVWRGQNGNGALSGSVAKRRGAAALFDKVWRSLRDAGLAMNTGRLMAPTWSGRAVKQN